MPHSARRVGPTGFAYGVDMIGEMLDLASVGSTDGDDRECQATAAIWSCSPHRLPCSKASGYTSRARSTSKRLSGV